MRLKKCLNMTKCREFEVFVYPDGHVRENRGLSECPIAEFSVERDKNGKIPKSRDLTKYGDCKVREIILNPNGSVNVVVETE